MHPEEDFEWEEELQDLERVGLCLVGYVKKKGQWYRVAFALDDLRDYAIRKVLENDQNVRKH